MTTTTKTRTGILFATALLVVIGMAPGCEPGVIAPLPSPVAPDEDLIVTSSLMMEVDEDQPVERLVAVVGFDGAVTGLGEVRFTSRRTQIETVFQTTEDGSFVATLFALPTDEYDVVFAIDDDRVSDSVTVRVTPLDADNKRISEAEPPANDEPPEDDDSPPPQTAQSDSDTDGDGTTDPSAPPLDNDYTNSAGAELDCGGNPDDPDADPADPDCNKRTDAEDEPTPDPSSGESFAGGGNAQPVFVTSFSNGEYEIQANAGMTSPGANLIFANTTTGKVHKTTADEYGGFIISFPAELGDEILLFTQHPDNPALTGEAKKFFVK